jgi:hypothetical protein
MKYLVALVVALALPMQVMAYGLTYVGKVTVAATFDTTNNSYTGNAYGSVSVTQNPSARPDSYIGLTMASGLQRKTDTAAATHPFIRFSAVDSTTGAKFTCNFQWDATNSPPVTEATEAAHDAWNRAYDAMQSFNSTSYLSVKAKGGNCTHIYHEKNSYMQETPPGGIATEY